MIAVCAFMPECFGLLVVLGDILTTKTCFGNAGVIKMVVETEVAHTLLWFEHIVWPVSHACP